VDRIGFRYSLGGAASVERLASRARHTAPPVPDSSHQRAVAARRGLLTLDTRSPGWLRLSAFCLLPPLERLSQHRAVLGGRGECAAGVDPNAGADRCPGRRLHVSARSRALCARASGGSGRCLCALTSSPLSDLCQGQHLQCVGHGAVPAGGMADAAAGAASELCGSSMGSAGPGGHRAHSCSGEPGRRRTTDRYCGDGLFRLVRFSPACL